MDVWRYTLSGIEAPTCTNDFRKRENIVSKVGVLQRNINMIADLGKNLLQNFVSMGSCRPEDIREES